MNPNPNEVNFTKMSVSERAKWDDDNSRVEVFCITPKCGVKGITTKQFANSIQNIGTGRVEYLCGRCLHRRLMKDLKEQAIAVEMEKEAAQAEQEKGV
jgi:hypothetical protein